MGLTIFHGTFLNIPTFSLNLIMLCLIQSNSKDDQKPMCYFYIGWNLFNGWSMCHHKHEHFNIDLPYMLIITCGNILGLQILEFLMTISSFSIPNSRKSLGFGSLSMGILGDWGNKTLKFIHLTLRLNNFLKSPSSNTIFNLCFMKVTYHQPI